MKRYAIEWLYGLDDTAENVEAAGRLNYILTHTPVACLESLANMWARRTSPMEAATKYRDLLADYGVTDRKITMF